VAQKDLATHITRAQIQTGPSNWPAQIPKDHHPDRRQMIRQTARRPSPVAHHSSLIHHTPHMPTPQAASQQTTPPRNLRLNLLPHAKGRPKPDGLLYIFAAIYRKI
tara:strand:- start:161777 stop:162094 length:318 start_codon:yes stop_codon:yes gene_type:complete